MHDPAETRPGQGREAAQVGEPGAQLRLGSTGQVCERAERALDHVRRVPRLPGEVGVLPPEGALSLVDLAEPGLAQPAGQPRSGVTPPRGGHALDHRAEERLERRRRRLGAARAVVHLDRGDPTAGNEHAPGLAERRRRLGEVLEEPHGPDVVERPVRERERERVGLEQGRLDTGLLEMPARVVELRGLDVDPVETDAGELLSQHGQHGAHAAADLEEPRPGLEGRAVRDEPVPPVLCLLDESLLLARAVPMDVLAHERVNAERARFHPRDAPPEGAKRGSLTGHIVTPMPVADRAERARGSFERRRWSEAFAELSAAHDESGLDVEDLERLAAAAYMVGREEACQDAWTAAHHAWLRRGEVERAARCAFWQALGLFFRGDLAPAMGWVARGGRLLEDSRGDSVERAWLRMLKALPLLFEGDADAACPSFVEAAEMADRFADADASMFARLGHGYSLILQGRVAEGMALLDEAMVAVTADEVAPILAGIAYCQVIALCQSAFDLRRAREWTEALTRWCDSQPGLVPFRGNCLVHRCEIFQLQGAWTDALDSARRACEWLAGPPAWDMLGSAHYQLAEIQRLRGELAEAEESYRQASLAGRDPEPGMSLLRLAQGRVDLARAAIRRALEETEDPLARSRLLPAYVEVMLRADDVAAARAATDELVEIAAGVDAPYLSALAAHASGAVLLAEGDQRAALTKLRSAYSSWRELEAPHEAARVRVLVGLACRELGDGATATLEFEAARRSLEDLGARPDLERLARLADSPRPGGLSRRESEVLSLVSAGKTNRQIAAELVISEKTVARHMSNIFAKLGLSSRTEATAWAYEHGLAR